MEVVEFLKSLSVGDLGFASLLSLAIFLILTGRIVPKSTVDDLREDRDARVGEAKEEAREWRQAYTTISAAFGELTVQFPVLIEYAKTSDHLLREITSRADQAERSRAR